MEWNCLMIFAITPIFLSIILNILDKNMSIEEFVDECKYFWKLTLKMSVIVFLIFFIQQILSYDKNVDESFVEVMMLKILYYLIMMSFVIIINYFSTRNQNFRLCMKSFLNEFMNFVQSNFSLNLIIVLLIIFVRGKLTDGLIGSFVFFILNETHKNYKDKIDYNKNNENKYKITQILLNVSMLYSFITVEKIINCLIKKDNVVITLSDASYLLIFLFCIIINCLTSKIDYSKIKNEKA